MATFSHDSEPVADGQRDLAGCEPVTSEHRHPAAPEPGSSMRASKHHDPLDSASGRLAGSPAMSRHQLGVSLRKLREARGLRIEEVAVRLEVAPNTVSRIETGKAPTRTSYLTVMLDMYDVGDDGERQRLVDLAIVGRRGSWLVTDREVLPPGLGRYVELEAAATAVCGFASQLIPGLLQTSEYAAISCRIGRPELEAEQVATLVYFQQKRHERLAASQHELHLVVDEAVLVRPVGSADVMATQLDHLHTASTWPQVTIQVLPLHRSWPVLAQAFAILTLADGSDVVAHGGMAGQVILTSRASDVSALRERFAALADAALSPAESASLIQTLAQAAC